MNVAVCVCVCVRYLLTAQIKMLREELSAERPQSVHESSNLLVGYVNDTQAALGQKSFPSDGRISVCCKPFCLL